MMMMDASETQGLHVLSPTGVIPDGMVVKPALRPFFIMDFLEELNEKDVERVRQFIQTPRKGDEPTEDRQGELDPVRRELYPETPQQTPVADKGNGSNSPFRQKSISVGNGWNAKGLLKAQNGCWEDALRCWHNALEIRRQVLGENHIDVANTYNNMGIALGKLSRAEEAVRMLQKAMAIRVTAFGYEHTEVAATLHNIGNVLGQAGDLEGAMQVFSDSMHIQTKLHGRNHVHVARACIAIGHVYCEAKQYKDACDAYNDALDIFAKVGMSPGDPEVQATQLDALDAEEILRGLGPEEP